MVRGEADDSRRPTSFMISLELNEFASLRPDVANDNGSSQGSHTSGGDPQDTGDLELIARGVADSSEGHSDSELDHLVTFSRTKWSTYRHPALERQFVRFVAPHRWSTSGA